MAAVSAQGGTAPKVSMALVRLTGANAHGLLPTTYEAKLGIGVKSPGVGVDRTNGSVGGIAGVLNR